MCEPLLTYSPTTSASLPNSTTRCHSVRSTFSPESLSFQASEVAREIFATACPCGLYRISGSFPTYPTIMTLLIPLAMAPPLKRNNPPEAPHRPWREWYSRSGALSLLPVYRRQLRRPLFANKNLSADARKELLQKGPGAVPRDLSTTPQSSRFRLSRRCGACALPTTQPHRLPGRAPRRGLLPPAHARHGRRDNRPRGSRGRTNELTATTSFASFSLNNSREPLTDVQ